MKKYKLQHSQKVISMLTGDIEKEQFFSDINGPIVGVSTAIYGTKAPTERADLSIMDGATTVLMPIDIAVTEVAGKTTFKGQIMPFTVENPGRVKAVIRASTPIAGSGQEYDVVVIIYYAAETLPIKTTLLSECIQ